MTKFVSALSIIMQQQGLSQMLSSLTLFLQVSHVSLTPRRTVSLQQAHQNSVAMRPECEELSETTDGHETTSLLLLMQGSMRYRQTRRLGIQCRWERRDIYILSNVLEMEVSEENHLFTDLVMKLLVHSMDVVTVLLLLVFLQIY